MATYYNAIVLTDYDTRIKYRNISNVEVFQQRILATVSVAKIFYYRKNRREDDKGILEFTYHPKYGKEFTR